jgi:hypothetical protein
MAGLTFVVHARVLRDGELFLSTVLGPGRPLQIGPDCNAAASAAAQAPLSLLVPVPGGYGLRLAPPLAGQVTVQGRTLRIQDGLLADPRPEPLILADGDHGRVLLDDDDNLELLFTVHQQQRRFAPRLTVEPGLALALGLTALAFAGLLVVVAPWQGSPKRRGPVEPKLTARPTLALRLARFKRARPRPAIRRSAGNRSERLHNGRRKAATRSKARARQGQGQAGVLGLLGQARRRHPQLFGSVDDPSRPDPLEQLDKLELALASVAVPSGPPAGGGRLGGGPGMGLVGLLGPAPSAEAGQGLSPARLALPAKAPLPVARAAARPSREEIRKVVARNSGPIRLCYERELLSSSRPLEGRLLLRWTIDAAGAVRDLEVVEDTVGSIGLRSCVLSRVRGWIFPACAQRCRITYPFDFHPTLS